MKENKEKRKIFKGEKIWYAILGVIWIFGLVLAILGMCAYNVGKLSTNALYAFEKSVAQFFKMQGVMDFRLVGTLFMIVAMIAIIIAIFYYSNKAIQEANRERRYQERMRILMEADNEQK